MKNILYTLAVASIMLVSCKKENSEETNTETTATDSTAVVDSTTSQIQPTQLNENGANPNTIMQQNPGSGMQPTIQPQTVATGKGMNPAHGQPGHRCDIAVGAPLNSPPGKENATMVQKQDVTAQQLQTGNATINPAAPNNAPATLATAPGMNPPHGQDGHVCSIAVGAPLP